MTTKVALTSDDLHWFAGWSWEHDCFCEGRGKPIGWLPFAPVPDGVDVPGEGKT